MPQEYTENRALIAERVKRARETAGMKQSDVAKELGITPQAVSNYERGINKIPNNVISQLATLFRTSSDYLLGLSNIPTVYSKDVIDMLGKDASGIPARYSQSVEELCMNLKSFATTIAKKYPSLLPYASDCFEASMYCFGNLIGIITSTEIDKYDPNRFRKEALQELNYMNMVYCSFISAIQSFAIETAEKEVNSPESTE